MEKKTSINPIADIKSIKNVFIQKLPYLIVISFSIFLAIGMYYHELWRDELEIYGKIAFNGNIKLNAADYSYLVYNLIMKVFLWVNESQTMYQFYHYVIIVSAIFLLNKYSPFSLFEKFFITFSYFLFYEYGVISRYYGFLVLLVFLLMFLLSRKKINYYLVIMPLIILADHSINSYIFSLAVFFYIINNLFKEFENKTLTKKLIISYTAVLIYFIIIGLIYFIYTSKQISAFEGLGQAPVFMTIRTIWNSFIPLPEFTNGAAFWNTNYFNFPILYPINYDINVFETTQNIILSVLSVLIFAVVLIKFSKKPIVFLIFLGNYLLILFFLHFARFYFIRHQGLLFIVFIYCYWLYHIDDGKIHIPILNKIKLDVLSKIKIDIIFKPMIIIILVSQFVSSSYALYKDYKYKFTLSYDAANFIKTNNLDKDHVFVGFIDYAAQTIAVNLKKEMYFPQSNSSSFVWQPFTKNYTRDIPLTNVFDACINYSEHENRKVILVLSFPLIDNNKQELNNSMLTNNSSIKLLKSFTGDIIQEDEQFWLYEITKTNN